MRLSTFLGVMGGRVRPLFWIPGLVPPPRLFLPGPKDCLRPQSLLGGREGPPVRLRLRLGGVESGQGLNPPTPRMDWGLHMAGAALTPSAG